MEWNHAVRWITTVKWCLMERDKDGGGPLCSALHPAWTHQVQTSPHKPITGLSSIQIHFSVKYLWFSLASACLVDIFTAGAKNSSALLLAIFPKLLFATNGYFVPKLQLHCKLQAKPSKFCCKLAAEWFIKFLSRSSNWRESINMLVPVLC